MKSIILKNVPMDNTGFVETKYRIGYEEGIATNTYNSLHIERIDPFAKGKTYLDDVLVVFCAKPENGQTVIVGWI